MTRRDELFNRENCPMLRLSRRQLQTLELLAAGKTLKEIAFHLHIHESTVRMHLAVVKRRLNTETLAQTVGVAVALGLCSPSLEGGICSSGQV